MCEKQGFWKIKLKVGNAALTKYLCVFDYYIFKMQNAVLDRTKTLGYGNDECNFLLMSETRAKEIRFKASPDAK